VARVSPSHGDWCRQCRARGRARRATGDPQPVHRYVIQESGIPIIEWVYLEELARERVYEFLFIFIPPPIRGTTASLIRPLAFARC
jgi:kynurenine formamidase